GTAAAVVVGFSSERTLRSAAGSLALGRAASPVQRRPRPSTGGVLGSGDPSAHPPTASDKGCQSVSLGLLFLR
ncbi:MAG: hypothetical protein ACRETD_09965, partial [Steroidobacteraceae bacterium]